MATPEPNAALDRVTWRSIPRPVQLITVAFILANLGGAMFYDQLAVYLNQELHAEVTNLGLFFMVTTILGAVTRVLGGWISDAIGHFRGLAIGSAIGCTGAVLMWWAPTWQLALGCYVFVLMGMSLVGPSASAAITVLTPVEQRSRIFGLTGGVFQIVGVLGPYVGGLIIAHYGWQTVLGLNAILLGVATLLRSGLMVYETQTLRRPRWHRLARDLRWFYGSIWVGGVFGILLMLDITTDFQVNLTYNLRALYLEAVRHLDADARGLLFTVSGVAAMPAMMVGGWLGDRFGELRTILLGLGIALFGFILFPYMPTVPWLCLPFLCWGFGMGLNEPTFRALISKVTPPERLATAFGTIIGSTNLLAFPAAKIGPQLYEHVSPQAPFLVAAVAQGILLLGLLVFARQLERRLAAHTSAVQ